MILERLIDLLPPFPIFLAHKKMRREIKSETQITWFQTCWSVKVKVLVAQLCLTLFHPMDCSMPGSSVHGISQAEILEWVAIPFSRGSSQPRDGIWVSWIVGRFFTIWATREAQSARKWKAIIFNDKNEVLTKLQDSLFLSLGASKAQFYFSAR